MRNTYLRFAPLRDPFKALGLSRTCTKAEVKAKYRELARRYHPDAESGNAQKMEEVNYAYKLLMKEGGYERLHLRPGDSSRVARDGGSRPEQVSSVPFVREQQDMSYRTGSGASWSPLSDDEMEKVSALDPATERRTPSGCYLYQNRDDGSWMELERPLLRAHQPRYASFKAQADVASDLRRQALEKEKAQNEKSAFDRMVDRLSDSSDLPTRNHYLLKLYGILVVIVLYTMYTKTVARGRHQSQRKFFYTSVEQQRDDLLRAYQDHKDGVEITLVAATLIFLAASNGKLASDAVQYPLPEVNYRSVRPPREHFNVISSV